MLENDIRSFIGCEVIASDNKDVLILVTDTADELAEKALFENLQRLENLQLLTLVSAFANDTESLKSK